MSGNCMPQVIERRRPIDLDISQPNPARMYDYWLGGKDNFAADRDEAERILEVAPQFRDIAAANRRFVERTVRYLSRKGIAQFLDLGAGLPASPNVHEVARETTTGARVAYVDNDPIVVCHGRALMATDAATTMIEADLRDPAAILEHADLRRLLDLDRPVAVMLTFVLEYIGEQDRPAGIVARLMRRLAPGSHLVISHFAGDVGHRGRRALSDVVRANDIAMFPRGRGEILGLFRGLDLLAPGLVQLPRWRPDSRLLGNVGRVCAYGGVARKLGPSSRTTWI